MRTWMNEKSLMKQQYLRKRNFMEAWIWKILQMQIKCMRKEFVMALK